MTPGYITAKKTNGMKSKLKKIKPNPHKDRIAVLFTANLTVE